MAPRLRQISKRCGTCRQRLSVKLTRSGSTLIRGGDAVGICTNSSCSRHEDDVEVDPQEV